MVVWNNRQHRSCNAVSETSVSHIFVSDLCISPSIYLSLYLFKSLSHRITVYIYMY